MIEHTTEGSVLDDLGFSPEQAENLKIRAKLLTSLVRYIQAHRYTQQQAAGALGVSQSQISRLMRGRVSLFTIDALINMHAAAGIPVSVEIGQVEA